MPCPLTNFIGIMKSNVDPLYLSEKVMQVPMIQAQMDHQWEKEKLKIQRQAQNYQFVASMS